MPSLLGRLLLTILCLWGSLALANGPLTDEVIVLNDNVPAVQVHTDVKSWIDEGSHATIALVAGDTVNFKSDRAENFYPLNKFDTLWIKLRVKRPMGNTAQWTLNVPLPFVDFVTLYQADGAGRWMAQRAGDSVSQSEWPRQGLYPDFDLTLADSTSKDLYLQIRNFKQLHVPIRLATAQQREWQRQLELLGLGLMLGALLSLAILSMLRYVEHRKAIDGWAALFGLLIATTLGQINGVMNTFVWARLPEIGNFASGAVPVVTVGCALLFVRNIFSLHVHHRRFDRFLSSVGWGTIASVLAYAVVDRFIADWISNVFMIFAVLIGIVATYQNRRDRAVVERWLMFALLPVFFSILYLVGEAAGIVPALWQMRYVTSLGVAIAVPVLLYALSQLTHDRKELVVRANHLPTQDALTGLLTPEVFQTHLETAVQRAIDHREPLALAMVRVTNHEHIRQAYSDTTAEQCLLRAVVKLQRILRDVDPAGRVGTAEFSLLMEGVATRQALTERMVKLIGSGLIPLPGLVPEVTLHFHVACVMLHDNPVPPERVLDDLRDLMAGMSPHTRRPIRFLEALPTEASQMHSQSDPA